MKPAWLIPFKAKAWLDLNERIERGEHVDSRDIKKHRNDILRMASELVFEPCELQGNVKQDMQEFVNSLQISEKELKNLKLVGIRSEEIINV